MRELVDVHYPGAEAIRLGVDSLNTHTAGALCAAFPPEEARRLARRLEWHYTPKTAYRNRSRWGRLGRMKTPLVPDDLWAAVAPLLPREPPKPKGGRPRVPDRAALAGILFVLHTGCGWERLPRELGCGSGMTCWRRLRPRQAAGGWDRLHRALLDRLGEADKIDRVRASPDAASVAAKGGASPRGRTRPTGASPAPSGT